MKGGVLEVKGSGSDMMSNSGQLVLSIARHAEGIERSLNIAEGRTEGELCQQLSEALR